jgi:hypothetical protein
VKDGGLLRRDLGQGIVQQPGATIERVGNSQLREGEFEDGPLILGWQVFPGEGIAVQGRA